MTQNSFDAKATLNVGDRSFEIFRLDALQSKYDVARLPFSLKILLENLLRNEDGETIRAQDVEALATWNATDEPSKEISFTPARVVMQDFTGVPAIVDLAAMRDAMADMGGDPNKINPLVPAELVIDHSVQVDAFGTHQAFERNAELEFERNQERYAFLRWGQGAFRNFKVVPPDTGIVHQVNLEYLARVVFVDDSDPDHPLAYPDTLVGTDSHTTMINGLGVLGWGVGGIEAEAAMLGQPMSMLIPQVLGFKLHGALPEGATATDLVLTVTEMLRQKGVVGKFVEFHGAGLAKLPLADRATIGNMSPEFGSTCAIFPIDAETLHYLEFSGRPREQIELVEAYAKEQGLWHDENSEETTYSDELELDLGDVVPSIAGPKRPQDRVSLTEAKSAFRMALDGILPDDDEEDEAIAESFPASDPVSTHHVNGDGHEPQGGTGGTQVADRKVVHAPVTLADGTETELDHGHVVIAAITSCTNTSNPSVMLGAGILARNAVQKGLKVKPWVKTSLAPGSKVVTEYLERAGLTEYLEDLGYHLVGYGCTTCIGNSGPLPEEISEVVNAEDLAVVSVLSGNRNFEGRINPDVKMNYLASPPLCVAYALAGTMDIDLYEDPLGEDKDGQPVFLKDIWPSAAEVAETVGDAVQSDMFRKSYGEVFDGDERWNTLEVPSGDSFAWADESTYVRKPPFFENLPKEPEPITDIEGARVLAILGDSVTTDHISPAGSIKRDGPAGAYLIEHDVKPKDFNSYGSRRGNHEVMMRGTFANIRLRNQLAPGTEGGLTLYLDGDEEQMSIYDAAMKYIEAGTALVVLAGKEYGSGSSRDWAAKGTRLLGVRAVIAESFERIHRSNLVGMGVLPLQFKDGDSVESLGLTGHETFSIGGLADADEIPREVTVHADDTEFTATVRIDTPKEQRYYHHGGILQFVLRQLLEVSIMAASEFFTQLLTTAGPSGHESAAAKTWREGCAKFTDDVGGDHVGSSYARVPGTGSGLSTAIVGHIDEIGVHITHIDDDGFLHFGEVGGWDPIVLIGQRVAITTRDGVVRGVCARKPIHLLKDDDREKVPELKDMHIDIGAKDGDDARERVRIGDVGVIDVAPLEMPNGRLVSRSMDNRVGCFVAAEAARLVAEAGGAPGDVLAMAVAQEETTFAGARTSAFAHKPGVAIAVDVTFATDQPGIDLGPRTKHEFGSGPVIARGTTLHPHVFEMLYEAAEAEGIPFTVESLGRATGTDADALHLSREGVPTGLVSVPLRYMHSPVEMVCLEDIDNAAKVIAAFARRLKPDTSFQR